MQFVKIGNYIEQFDSLIRKESTGPASEFSKKLGISERTLRNHLQQLREIGVEIVYDSFRRTYYYPKKGQIIFGFTPDSND